ncbi:hypothetical protein B0H67DRAFT_585822 [Lasiosphaeris hirsuta]|uniref:Uncharacterized protein n=1 Tax=Lasiosphaeris hirsuta TaxID=260670 RepID=A0AA40A9C3_9PEZI|nr:hypothetical protein B0H67DRAFT_585822 [Lasiosphaeris hirsuta]
MVVHLRHCRLSVAKRGATDSEDVSRPTPYLLLLSRWVPNPGRACSRYRRLSIESRFELEILYCLNAIYKWNNTAWFKTSRRHFMEVDTCLARIQRNILSVQLLSYAV